MRAEQSERDIGLAVALGGAAVAVTAIGLGLWGRRQGSIAAELRSTINHERRQSATELEMLRKRNAEELSKNKDFANQAFAKTLLDVSDNLVRLVAECEMN